MVVSIERYMGVSVSVSMCISIGYSTGYLTGSYVVISMDSTIRSCASGFTGDYAGHYEGGYKGSRTGASIGRFMRGCRSTGFPHRRPTLAIPRPVRQVTHRPIEPTRIVIDGRGDSADAQQVVFFPWCSPHKCDCGAVWISCE